MNHECFEFKVAGWTFAGASLYICSLWAKAQKEESAWLNIDDIDVQLWMISMKAADLVL